MREKVLNADAKGACAVFLDRDGVINEEVDLLHRPEQFKLIEGSAEGIKMLNDAGLPVIVVTNQPVVARGMCSEETVDEIHTKMGRLLAGHGAKVDAIYWCPHSKLADVPKYRKECGYRKPEAGMLKAAATRFGLDMGQCFIVGDSTRDIKAGENAGCKTIAVETGLGCKDGREQVAGPDYECRDLRAAAELILRLVSG